jgi:hypothetical protein
MNQSLFLKAYEERIKHIIKELQTISMMSIPTGTVELSEVANLLKGCIVEIGKQNDKIIDLQKNIDEFINENNRLKKELFECDDNEPNTYV